ncbi:MAG TPA: SGNH/GDSL hydrolase family protein [Bryobacteraceae bacterium]|nr:SGNH/GDSL hydrolase family protein [Bryobacteraceae bacterium]
MATWAAAQQQPRVFRPGRGGPGRGAPGRATGRGNATPPPAPGFNNQTVRMIAHTSLGGRSVRVALSNEHSAAPLKIGAAHIALREKGSAIVPGTDRPLLFNGKASVTIPPEARVLSDAVDLGVPALSDVAVSVYLPGDTGPATTHSLGLHTTYISQPGDFTGAASIDSARTAQSWYFLSDIDVLAPADAGAIVAFGDSITDGARSTPDTNRSWPSRLAERLNGVPADLAVVNEGISGNRVLRDGAGISALARFDRDVLGQPGVKWVILLEGINDIGIAGRPTSPAADKVTADDIIGALAQMVDRAHMHGIKVMGCTLTHFEGASYYSDSGEAIREAVNQWIRMSGTFDAVSDFDAVARDPNNPKQIRPNFNDGDHLHPNDAGYKAIADSIDLSVFSPKAAPVSARAARTQGR